MRHRLAPEADYYRLPTPSRPAPTAGFAVCTADSIPGCTDEHWANVQQVYAAALAKLGASHDATSFGDDLYFWN